MIDADICNVDQGKSKLVNDWFIHRVHLVSIVHTKVL